MFSKSSLLNIKDTVNRRVVFMALFSKEMTERGYKPPVVVGGEAVEIYTQGSYTTGDVDIKSSKKATEEILKSWGFMNLGRSWINKEIDIHIDWLGETLEEGIEAENRVNKIQIDEGLEIKVISIEDLVIDRLNAAKWWGDSDSFMWAKVLIKVKEGIGEKPDFDYLQKRAEKDDIDDTLKKMLLELSNLS